MQTSSQRKTINKIKILINYSMGFSIIVQHESKFTVITMISTVKLLFRKLGIGLYYNIMSESVNY